MNASRRTDRKEEQLVFWQIDKPLPPRKKKASEKRKRPTPVTKQRQQNLRYLVDTRYEGSVERLAQIVKLTSQQLVDAYRGQSDNSILRHRAARCIERACGLETGWLDRVHADATSIAMKISSLDTESRFIVDSVIDAFLAKEKVTNTGSRTV